MNMDITKAPSGYEDGDMSELEDESEDSEETDTSDEDAAISVAIGSDDPDRIEAFKEALELCAKRVGK
jgi:hypothetical protein